MAKLLKLSETEDEVIIRQTIYLITKAIRECNDSVSEIRRLAIKSGGKTAFLAKLGSNSAGITSAYTDLKTLVEKISDLSVVNL